MTYRFYLTIGSSEVEVFPLNFLKTSLVDAIENGQIFYRRKFSSTLRFRNDAALGITDFTLINLTETLILTHALDCQDLILRIEQRDSGADTYHIYWTGHFATSDGKFDLDQCTYDITPLPYDDYKNFDLNGDTEYNILNVAPVVTTNIFGQAYTRNRWLIDVIEYLVAQIEPAATVTSWFFNDPTNYVIGGVNQYQYLTIAQKSDIRRPASTNPATLALLSFNELMNILKMYNVFWTYDGTTVRIEHLSYWDSAAGLDLRTQAIAQKQNKYSYSKEDMPRFEKFSFMEAGDTNYTTHTIRYDDVCVNNDKNSNTVEYSSRVTTDLGYIIECETDADLAGTISDDGFVILANYYDGSDYQVYYGTAYENSNGSYNYVNSWSYLLRAFFRHGRVLMEGFINTTAINFMSARKTKIQDIKAIVCWEDNYDPNDYITTELGEDYFNGQKGYVKNASIKPTGEVAFQLQYGEDEDGLAAMPTRPKELHVVIPTDSYTDIYSYLSEPNIYDTYYWIFWNEGVDGEVCQEIMIPAGTVYQHDAADLVEIFASITFYFAHSSLTGWVYHYNDNDPITLNTSPPCPAVPPAPPAVPDPPVATTVTQPSTCGYLKVHWLSSVGATYYNIYRKPNVSMVDAYGLIGTEVGNDYYDYDAGVLDGQTFYYKIQACNISGCSGDSNEINGTANC